MRSHDSALTSPLIYRPGEIIAGTDRKWWIAIGRKQRNFNAISISISISLPASSLDDLSFLINVLMANDFNLVRSTVDEIALINGLPG